jgi:hypothetical protein
MHRAEQALAPAPPYSTQSLPGGYRAMKERFEGNNRSNLIDALKRQELVAGDVAIAEAIADQGELVEFAKGDKLIIEDAEDNDIYLLLCGLGLDCDQRKRVYNA